MAANWLFFFLLLMIHMLKRGGKEDEDFSNGDKCSKGCESGWTVYLDESLSNRSEKLGAGGEEFNRGGRNYDGEEEEEEENLSMVSDASSGPPSREVEEECSHGSCSTGKRRGKKNAAKESGKGEEQKQHPSYHYVDTACSPYPKFTKQEKSESRNFHRSKNSAAPATEKASSGKKGGVKNRKWA